MNSPSLSFPVPPCPALLVMLLRLLFSMACKGCVDNRIRPISNGPVHQTSVAAALGVRCESASALYAQGFVISNK